MPAETAVTVAVDPEKIMETAIRSNHRMDKAKAKVKEDNNRKARPPPLLEDQIHMRLMYVSFFRPVLIGADNL